MNALQLLKERELRAQLRHNSKKQSLAAPNPAIAFRASLPSNWRKRRFFDPVEVQRSVLRGDARQLALSPVSFNPRSPARRFVWMVAIRA